MLSNGGLSPQVQSTFPPNQHLNRSCESCRSLKVRCLPTSTPQCQRCVKANRQCVFVAPQRKRARVRTDARVAQLEKEVRDLQSKLKGHHLTLSSADVNDAEDVADAATQSVNSHTDGTVVMDQSISGVQQHAPHLADSLTIQESHQNSGSDFSTMTSSILATEENLKDQEIGDVIDRGIISLEIATELAFLYLNEYVKFYPTVVFQPGTTPSHLRQTKPLLFLAILSAAALSFDGDLAKALQQEVVRAVADKLIIKAEKSIELIQALMVMVVFSYPPANPSRLHLSQYTNIAATTVLELGLATKPCPQQQQGSKISDHNQSEPLDGEFLERARVVLTCYLLVANAAMIIRRPVLLTFNKWMEHCLASIKTSDRFEDKQLAAFVELRMIADDVSAGFGYEDSMTEIRISDPSIQAIMKLLDRRLEEWRKGLDNDVFGVPLRNEYYTVIIALYEITLGNGGRDVEAPKQQQITLPTLDDPSGPQPRKHTTIISAAHIDGTLKCLQAAQGSLDAFLSLDMETIRKYPNLFFARSFLALLELLKIYFAVRSGVLLDLIDPLLLQVDCYLDTMISKLTQASADGKYRIPSHWLRVITNGAKDWYEQFQARQARQHTGGEDKQDVPLRSSGSADIATGVSAPTTVLEGVHTTAPTYDTDSTVVPPSSSSLLPEAFVPMDLAGIPMDLSNSFFGQELAGDLDGWWAEDENAFGYQEFA